MTQQRLRVAVIGYGHVGRAACETLQDSSDMELAGIVRRRSSLGDELPRRRHRVPVVSDIEQLEDVRVALLCVPSRIVPALEATILDRGICTVDSYDMHGAPILDLRERLQPVTSARGTVAIIGAGWDPGADSVIRALLCAMAPRGVTYTNFGPGLSLGHTAAAKAVPGVRDALSFTIPVGMGKHRREVYVQLDQEAEVETVTQGICADPYFRHDQTEVIARDDLDSVLNFGHGVVIERYGAAGRAHNQFFRFQARVTNPAVTAQVMVAAARVIPLRRPGVYTLLDIPVGDLLAGGRDQLLGSLL